MNEQLQNSVVEILNRAISGIDSSVAFMQAELPDVINQLLMWYGLKNSIVGLIGGLILYLCYKSIKKPEKGCTNWMWDWCQVESIHKESSNAWFAIFIIFPIFFGSVMLSHLMDTIQIWIAPKIWLMEYAASIVK